jgi:hypothetical protein
VAAGEDQTIAGWLEYGEALNEWRRPRRGKEYDRAFGEWVRGISPKLGDIYSGNLPEEKDEQAAMWAASDTHRFHETRLANPSVRTVRGLHAKWKEAVIKPARRLEGGQNSLPRKPETLR